MILHVCSLDKFIPPFVKLIDEEFSDKDHQFWVVGVQKLKQYPIEGADNVFIVKRSVVAQVFAYVRLIFMLHRAEKVILHGLFNIRVVVILALCPWLHRKCYWVLWGGDLYVKRNGKRTFSWKVKEFFRRPVIRRFRVIVTTVPGDFDLAKKWYSTKAKFIHSLMYSSHVAREIKLSDEMSKVQLNIQVGNSADPENRHLEVFKDLERLLSNEDFYVYCPLSYGNAEYARVMEGMGEAMFGRRFYPLVEFMSFDDYNDYLSKIDVAIFNHQRQQAMGNIIGLLSMGKTVYLRSSETPYHYLAGLGVKILDFESLGEKLYKLNEKEKSENVRIIQKHFTEKNLVDSWEKVFND